MLFDRFSRFVFHFVPLKALLRSPLGKKIIFSGGGNVNIDFSKSTAVYQSICSCGIRINRKNAEGNILVSDEAYEPLRNELIQLLLGLTDPETGQHCVKKVYRREEVYGKDAVNDPLDLILEMEPGYSTQELLTPISGSPNSSSGKRRHLGVLTPPGFYDWIGDHQPDGIVFMYGPNVKPHQKISASVVDIVPTVLALMGLSIPDSLEGNVIKEADVNPSKIKKIHWVPKTTTKNLLTNGEMKKIRELRAKL